MKKAHLQKHYNFYSKARLPFFNLIFALVWWNFFIRLFISLKFLGSMDSPANEYIPKSIAFFQENISIASLVVSLFAIMDWYFDNFLAKKLFKNSPVGITIIRKFIDNIVGFVIVGTIMATYYYSFEKELGFIETLSHLNNFFFNPVTLYFFIVATLISLSLTMLQSVQQNLGWSNFISLIIGKYRKPKEEDRIFLFVDLVSSTEVAEKLGHKKYSVFLQECYKIMSNAILLTHATVYQFVGDEAVLTWKSSKAKNYLKAADFFYQFQADLEKKRNYFENEFGYFPKFTASINSGNIMVAEVGEIKNAIAYHGDVLNTAARIQKKCKQYDASLLSTEMFAVKLKDQKNGYNIEYLDEVLLSGKKESVKIYSINLN